MEPAGSKEPLAPADLPPSGLFTAAYSARQSPASGFQVVRCPGAGMALSEAVGMGTSGFQMVWCPRAGMTLSGA